MSSFLLPHDPFALALHRRNLRRDVRLEQGSVTVRFITTARSTRGRVLAWPCMSIWIVSPVVFGQRPDTQATEARVDFSRAKIDSQGVRTHRVHSALQSTKTRLHIVLPRRWTKGEGPSRSLYVLPVEAGDEHRWGDPVEELLKHDIANRFQCICIVPTFSQLPWYADHPTDSRLQQESYFVDQIVPFIDREYGSGRDGTNRLLLGFSKSGWGAFTLVLRHSEQFEKAAAFDAPFMMDAPGKYGSQLVFDTTKNFRRYQVTSLLAAQAATFKKSERLFMLGFDKFRTHHRQCHDLMVDREILHRHIDGPQRAHNWHSGWLLDAVRLLTNSSDRKDSQR